MKQSMAILQKIGIVVGIGATMSLANAGNLYQVTQPSGQVSMTDNIDTAFKLSGNNTQNIKVIDTLATNNPVPALPSNAPSTPANLPSPPLPSSSANVPVTASQTSNINTPLTLPSLSNPEKLTAPKLPISKQGDYQLQILSPIQDTLYHYPAQSIDISVDVSPTLREGDSVAYWIDDKKIAQSQDLNLTIGSQEIPLGSHNLRVEVNNILSQPIAFAQVDFYVSQNNIAMQKRRKLEQLKEQLEAYDDLPWYQKLAVRLGIQKK